MATDPNTPNLDDNPDPSEDQLFEEAARLVDKQQDDPLNPERQTDLFEDQKLEEASASEPGDSTDTTPPAGDPPAGEPPAEDLWAGLSDTQRDALAELQRGRARAEHAFESQRNRLAAHHRKLNAAEQELEQLRQAQTPDSSAPPTESQPAPEPARTEEVPAVDMAKFQEDFPEVYAAMRANQQQEMAAVRTELNTHFQKEVDALKAQLGEATQPIQELREDRESAFRQTQEEALTAIHPDWQEIQTREEFWGWLDLQTPGVRALAGSSAAEDNVLLLNIYKEQRAVQQQAAQPTSPTPPPSRRPREPDADEQLPRTATGRPAQPLDGANEDQMWDYWAKQVDTNRL